MNLCSDNHKEVCYEGNECPVCKCLIEIEDLEKQIEDANAEIEDLKQQIP